MGILEWSSVQNRATGLMLEKQSAFDSLKKSGDGFIGDSGSIAVDWKELWRPQTSPSGDRVRSDEAGSSGFGLTKSGRIVLAGVNAPPESAQDSKTAPTNPGDTTEATLAPQKATPEKQPAPSGPSDTTRATEVPQNTAPEDKVSPASPSDTTKTTDAAPAPQQPKDNDLTSKTPAELAREAFSADKLLPWGHTLITPLASLLYSSKDSIKNFGAVTLAAAEKGVLDHYQKAHFNYFRQESHPVTGLTKDRSTPDSPCSVAGVGFSLSAHIIAAERGWITKEESTDYTLKVLRTLWNTPQGESPEGTSGYKGFFYHFIDPQNGTRSANCELSTVDTALLMAGVLSSAEYFKGNSEQEIEIRTLAENLYNRVDWAWAMRGKDHMSMGWYPDQGFIEHEWKGYNEGMLLLILGLASPTHPIPAKSWNAYTDSYQTSEINGKKFIDFAPMFGHQYSHSWIDFRGINDHVNKSMGFDYFENSRRAVLAQHDYAVRNPLGWLGYDKLNWGITASDGPGLISKMFNGKLFEFHGYKARGPGEFDDGTLAPTAVAASMPFAPELILPTLLHWTVTRPELWSALGFKDAFNPSFDSTKPSGWVASDTLAIDQGPIVLMMENYRKQTIWNLMQNSKPIVDGLLRAGFTGGWLDQKTLDRQAPKKVPTP